MLKKTKQRHLKLKKKESDKIKKEKADTYKDMPIETLDSSRKNFLTWRGLA